MFGYGKTHLNVHTWVGLIVFQRTKISKRGMWTNEALKTKMDGVDKGTHSLRRESMDHGTSQ
jgi:hypothetical protein